MRGESLKNGKKLMPKKNSEKKYFFFLKRYRLQMVWGGRCFRISGKGAGLKIQKMGEGREKKKS